jgi:hypothetical protein
LEHSDGVVIDKAPAADHLQGNSAARMGLLSLVDHSHTARSDPGNDPILPMNEAAVKDGHQVKQRWGCPAHSQGKYSHHP